MGPSERAEDLRIAREFLKYSTVRLNRERGLVKRDGRPIPIDSDMLPFDAVVRCEPPPRPAQQKKKK
ncbi:MAG: hypothetical protein Q7R47_02495 [Candidatus Diapherotrites archaeon]|nr:hypothetical protein [Candidatus Diapherotrites archaeon]